MKAWTLGEFGPHQEVLQWQEIPAPEPSPGQVRIRVGATGINFPDLLCIEGKYQVKPPLPFTPGMEAMGVVETVGSDCRLLKVGDRVIGSATVGAFAEVMLLDESSSYRIPDAMTDEDAGGFLVTHQTSYFALVHRAQLQPEEVLLVHGGAGGVGTTAIQLGKILGATAIAALAAVGAKWMLGSNVPRHEGMVAGLLGDSMPWLVQPALAASTAFIFGVVYLAVTSRLGVGAPLRQLLGRRPNSPDSL